MAGITLIEALAVAGGAALGGLTRWFVGMWLNPVWVDGIPLGTLAVNCAGGLLIGIAMFVFSRSPDELMRLLTVTGFLGGLTTFSSFSAESLGLLQRDEWGLAFAHSAAHLLGALACAALGFRIARLMLA